MRTTKETKFMTAVFILAGCLAFSSCGNDYDLSDLDKTIGINADGLKLTTDNSTNNIILDDLLKIEGNDLVHIAANGDYTFGKQPDPISPVNIQINDISFSAPTTPTQDVEITLPSELSPLIGTNYTVPAGSDFANISQWITAFQYETNVTAEVRELDYVVLEGENATVTITIPEKIKEIENFAIQLPTFVGLEYVSSGSTTGGTFNSNTNTVTFPSIKNKTTVTLKFKINKFKAQSLDSRNFVTFTPKTKPNQGELKMHGDVFITGTVKKIVVPSDLKLKISGQIAIGSLHITKVKGTFDPDIDLNKLGDVTITNIPDFLEDEEVVVDLDNPRLLITLDSDLPLGGTIKGKITSDVYSEGILLDSGDKIIKIKASPDGTSQKTQVLLCRYNPDPSTYKAPDYQVIEDENLSKLVRKLHDNMKINFDITEARVEQVSKEVSTGNYTLAPDYEFSAPLAFGPEAIIVYRDTINDWSHDLKDIKLSKNGYVELTGTAINSVPADLTIDIQVIGKPDDNGQFPRLDIANAQGVKHFDVNLIQKTAYGSKTGITVSPIQVELHDLTGEGIPLLDGIIIRLKANSNASMRGVTLNKSSQTLRIENITGTVHGTIIYDGN